MKHNTYAIVTVLLITLVIIPRPGLAGGSRAAPLVTPVTKTWTIDPDSTARRGLKPGFSMRLRFVETENIIGLGRPNTPAAMDAIRIRARIWAEAWFTPNSKGHVQLNRERIDFYNCETCEDKGKEVVIENLYLEAFDIGGAPVGLRLGRQNLFYGDGLVICDGTPLDGSRTLYVNAALVSFAIPEWAVDIFAASNHEKDDLLPAIDDEDMQLIETDECLMGIYARTMPYRGETRSFTFEPYFIIKRERTETWQDRISTIGGRLVVPTRRTRLRAEAAYQTGHKHHDYEQGAEAKNISAFGGTAYFNIVLEQYWNLDLGAGYVYLAGDNRKTHGKFEGWNPVLGRWPQWSELYIYTLIPEYGVAYWQNINFPMLQARFEPYKGLFFDAKVLWMYANRPDPGPCQIGAEVDDPESYKRGNLYGLKLSYKIGKHLFGHLLYEHFAPGGYYDWLWWQCGISGEPRAADFLRFEVSFTI
jgi:ribosomal protein L34